MLGFAIVLACIAGLLTLGVLYQQRGMSADALRHPPPGNLWSIGNCRLHVSPSGIGGPPVVLEAGISATSLSWALVQPGIAEFARVYAYDRAGLGWSEPSPHPRTAAQAASELRLLLEAANIPVPCVLVGHSYGCLVLRAFASRYPESVAGLVLVDPLSAETWVEPPSSEVKRLKLGVALARRGAFLARLGVVRLALSLLVSGGRRLPQAIARTTASGKGAAVAERLAGEVRKLPPELWPIIRAHWSVPKSFAAMAGYLENLPASSREISQLGGFGSIPVVVLSAERGNPSDVSLQKHLANLSSRGEHHLIENTGHWIHLDRPEVVVEAVRKVVERNAPV